MTKNEDFSIEKRKGTLKFTAPGNHYHEQYELYYLKSGNCNYFIDNKIYSVNTHDIVIVPSGVIHNTTYSDTDYERILLMFSKDYINPILISKMQYIIKKRLYRSKNISFIENLLEKIEEEYSLKTDISNELIKCYMTELFSYMTRNASQYIDNKGVKNSVIEEITKYISENYSQDLTLDILAERAGFSKYYFSKYFKASTGFGYKEFVLTVRLKEAKKMLSTTKKSVCEIAFSCGFNDSNYFSSIFKKTQGLSPVQFRKKTYSK